MSCVYFAEQVGGRLIKIGWTSGCPKERIRSLQTGSPVTIKLVGIIPAETAAAEKAIHQQFAHLRVKGEWFKKSKDILALLPKPPPPPRKPRLKAVDPLQQVTFDEWCEASGLHYTELVTLSGIKESSACARLKDMADGGIIEVRGVRKGCGAGEGD